MGREFPRPAAKTGKLSGMRDCSSSKAEEVYCEAKRAVDPLIRLAENRTML
jgi:hypothetical protein